MSNNILLLNNETIAQLLLLIPLIGNESNPGLMFPGERFGMAHMCIYPSIHASM